MAEQLDEFDPGAGPKRESHEDRSAVRWVVGAAAAVLCLVAIPQPLWHARLEAPQYNGAGALHLTAYGERLVGDICEINGLNHYIGMRQLGEPRVPCGSASLGLGVNTVGRIAPEMILWLPAAVVAAGAVLVVAVTRRRWIRRAASVFVWGLPVGVLAMTQYHLYVYGHDLDPAAAFRPEPFTPRVLGPSKIYQFDVLAWPGLALILIIAAALVASFGTTVYNTYMARRGATHVSASVTVVLVAALVLLPAVARASDDAGGSTPTTTLPNDHGNHMNRDGEDDSSGAPNALGAELIARLAAARTGDTVMVTPGAYRGNFVVTVPITLRGEGRPTLDGGGFGTVLKIAAAAAGTTVSGFRLTGSGPGPLDTPSGLLIQADGVTVEDVEITNTYMGIQVMGVAGAYLADNVIESFADGGVEGEIHATGGTADATGLDRANSAASGGRMRGDAITLWNSTGAVVEGNRINDTRDGIYLSFANETTLRDNDVRDSRYAIHGMYASDLRADHNYFEGNLAGAILMYGGPFDLRNNTILYSRSPSTGIGIVLKDGSGATVIDNIIVANRVGIKLDNGGATSSVPATVRSNTIGLNQVGIEIMQSSRGSFSRNSFVENTMQVVTDGEVPNIEWTVAGFGNYWSNYKGYDAAGDGIGDVPFVEGGSIARTLTRAPVLMSLASGPAFRLLQAVEDRWASEDPVVLDDSPLIAMESPAVDDDLRSQPASRWWGLTGALIAVGAWWPLHRARKPRRLRYV